MEFLVGLVALLSFLVVIIVLVAGNSVVYGMTLSVLWHWFMVPIFAAPELGVAKAIGLSLVIGYLTHKNIPEPVEPEPKTDAERRARNTKSVVKFFEPMLRAIGVLIVGFVVHLFVQ